MATRFSEIAGFLSATLAFTIFPFTAEKSAAGEDTRPLLLKVIGANAIFCLILAMPFFFCGKWILSMLPHGDRYAVYWWAVPWLIGITFITSVISFFMTTEISANRFGFMKWMIPIDLAYPALLLLVTGYGYYASYIPASWSAFLDAHNIRSLDTMLWWMTAINALKASACLYHLLHRNR